MAKLVVSEEVSLDGVVQDPTGEEGFRHGGWFNQVGEETRRAWAEVKTQEAFATTALLLGRKTDEWFGSRWSSREGEWADRLNGLPKYVVSSKLVDPVWGNSTVLQGDVVREVTRLKRELDGELVVFASRALTQTLLEHDLVDEVRLDGLPRRARRRRVALRRAERSATAPSPRRADARRRSRTAPVRAGTRLTACRRGTAVSPSPFAVTGVPDRRQSERSVRVTAEP